MTANISNAAYHSDPVISVSHLYAVAHFKATLINHRHYFYGKSRNP